MARLISSQKLALLVATGLALCGAFQLLRGFTALFAPVSTDYSEMMVAGMSQQLRDTGRLAFIYTPPDAPYAMPGVQYPPLFMALTALLIKFSGASAVLAARLLAWLGYAAAGLLVGGLVYQATGHRRLALCAAFFPFTFWSVLIFINGARPDPLALFLSLLAVRVYLSKGPPPGRSSHSPTGQPDGPKFKVQLSMLFLVAFILVLAFYAKQTYLAAAAAIFFHLLLTKGRRGQALFFGVSYALLALLGFGLCQALSEGQFAGIFEPQRAGRFIFQLAPAMVGFFLLDHAAIIAVALIGLVWQWQRGQRFWPLYLFFAAAACSSIVKDGAVDYYFNELAYLLCIQAAIAFNIRAFAGEQPDRPIFKVSVPKLRTLITWLLAVQMLVAIGMLFAWNQWRDDTNFGEVYREARGIVEQYQQSGRPALVLQNNYLLETNRAREIGDYFIYWILIGNGQRDIRPFQADLEMRRYEMILVGSPEFRRWPPVLEQPLQRGYNLRILSGKDGRPLYWLYTRLPGIYHSKEGDV